MLNGPMICHAGDEMKMTMKVIVSNENDNEDDSDDDHHHHEFG